MILLRFVNDLLDEIDSIETKKFVIKTSKYVKFKEIKVLLTCYASDDILSLMLLGLCI